MSDSQLKIELPPAPEPTVETPRSLRTAGLFAGIGGVELGLERAGHETAMLCELDDRANDVLDDRFERVSERQTDVRECELPAGIELVTAGFPCQDLSQAGRTQGMRGSESSLVSHVFRLLDSNDVPWVLLENVSNMLRLDRGDAMRYLADEFEHRDYKWAYRVIDTRAFGIPQRRKRVFLIASRVADPAVTLFDMSVAEPTPLNHEGRPVGFYWTEGNRGLGWAVDAVPTLKGGSGVGIPSPPAIWMTDDRIVTPDIRDAERLQGFEADWTAAAGERQGRFRWKLVGNAVTVDAAAWVGRVIARIPEHGERPYGAKPLPVQGSWPVAAFGSGEGRYSVGVSEWPSIPARITPIDEFLQYEPKLLSARATAGFYKRLMASTLRRPEAFERALEGQLEALEAAPLAV